MFWFSAVLAAASLSFAVAQSESFTDSSTGITFQRVQDDTDGSSVAIALPPQGANASDAIIQITGPVSQGFVGISPAPDLKLSILSICCWCCEAEAKRSLKKSPLKPKFGSRHLIGSSHKGPGTAIQPVFTQIAEPEITDTTFKITFRCQNCTFAESKDSKLTTLSTIASTNAPSSISESDLKFNPATDIVKNVDFDLAAARFNDYWNVVDRL